MSLCLDVHKFRDFLLAATLVVLGVLVKNGGDQYYKNALSHPLWPMVLGGALFVAGWTWLGKQTRSYDGVGFIVVSVMVMMVAKYKNGNVMPSWAKWMAIGFGLGWLLLADKVGRAHKTSLTPKYLAFAAAFMVLLSMLGFLPWQRKHGVVDGPGMVLFGGAWVLMAMAHSAGNKSIVI